MHYKPWVTVGPSVALPSLSREHSLRLSHPAHSAPHSVDHFSAIRVRRNRGTRSGGPPSRRETREALSRSHDALSGGQVADLGDMLWAKPGRLGPAPARPLGVEDKAGFGWGKHTHKHTQQQDTVHDAFGPLMTALVS